MAKITLPSIASGYNPATINSNFQLIASALNDRVLYRGNVGVEPNQMLNMLDMNNFRIVNLPAPLTETEPFRKKDATDLIINANGFAAAAAASATASANSAANSAASASQAANSAAQVIASGAQQLNALIAQGEIQSSQLAAQGQAQVQQVISAGQEFVNSAAASAAEAANSASEAGTLLTLTTSQANVALTAADDAFNSYVQADAIASALGGGTIGFDAVAYDFGGVNDPVTYFNRDFGSIV